MKDKTKKYKKKYKALKKQYKILQKEYQRLIQIESDYNEMRERS